MTPRKPHLALCLAGAALMSLAACSSDESKATELSPAACDAYASIGAAMFGDPSSLPTSITTLIDEAPEELDDALTIYGDAVQASFDGDENAMSSEEFLAADREIGAAVYDSCDTSATLDVVGIDYAFEGIPDELDAGRVAVRFTNSTDADEAHEMFIVKRADGVTESVAELLQLPQDDLFGKVVPVAVAYADEAGGVNVALTDLEPGAYIAFCMIPAIPDEAPHANHGMVDEFVVV